VRAAVRVHAELEPSGVQPVRQRLHPRRELGLALVDRAVVRVPATHPAAVHVDVLVAQLVPAKGDQRRPRRFHAGLVGTAPRAADEFTVIDC
jgi:hypothetical protein